MYIVPKFKVLFPPPLNSNGAAAWHFVPCTMTTTTRDDSETRHLALLIFVWAALDDGRDSGGRMSSDKAACCKTLHHCTALYVEVSQARFETSRPVGRSSDQ